MQFVGCLEEDNMALKQEKAKKILRHGVIRGKALTKKQKGLFGVIAGGKTPKISAAKQAIRKSFA